jgi:hypothetical protein
MSLYLNPVKGIWDIYDSQNRPIASFDTFLDYEASQESKVLTMPVENGGFAGYNKVASPYAVTVRLARSGSPNVLAQFIAALEKFANSTDLVTVMTPHKVYTNANIESFNHVMKREAGISSLVAELFLVEVRQVSPTYKSVRYAGHNRPVDRGLVQGKPPRTSLLASGVNAARGL